MATFFEELKEQRWDDHRYYHHSRINQSLHLVSACSFLVTYVLLFTHPVVAALFGWLFAMCIRQVGHFFFEPKGYDEVNQATHEYKEEVKVGYNLRRKVVLHSIWALSPLLLCVEPTLFGLSRRRTPTSAASCSTCRAVWLGLAARRAAVPHRPPVLHPRRADRAGVVHEDPHRPVPRHQAVPQGAAATCCAAS